SVRGATPDDEPAIRANYDRRARDCAGNLDRSPEIWRWVLRPPAGVGQTFVVEGAPGPEGHGAYPKRPAPGGGSKRAGADDVALTPAAARRIATFFADHKSIVHEVGWRGSAGDPILAVLREQSLVHARLWDVFMLRILDVAKAIEARGYAPGVSAEVHLDVV